MTNRFTIVVIIRREKVTQKDVSPTRAKGTHWNILSTFFHKIFDPPDLEREWWAWCRAWWAITNKYFEQGPNLTSELQHFCYLLKNTKCKVRENQSPALGNLSFLKGGRLLWGQSSCTLPRWKGHQGLGTVFLENVSPVLIRMTLLMPMNYIFQGPNSCPRVRISCELTPHDRPQV